MTVLLPVYNGARYVSDAIQSVLAQTFTSFELLIVDDGSTDATPDIIKSFHDPRLVLHCNDANLGLVRSLNLGLRSARGEYLARLDADDACEPDRLARQVAFLDRRPNVAALATGTLKIDSVGRSLGPRPVPTDPTDVRWRLLFHNPLVHSTMMIRKKAFDVLGGFDDAFRHAEDYEMWCRIAKRMPIAALEDALVRKRVHPASITQTTKSETPRLITLRYLRDVLTAIRFRDEDYDTRFVIDAYGLLYRPQQRLDEERARVVAARILRLHDAFCRYYRLADDVERRRSRRLKVLLRRRMLAIARRRLRDHRPSSAFRAAGIALRL